MSALTDAAIEVAKAAAGALVGASAVAVQKALEGGSLDDSLAAAIEHLADVRARAKFPDFRPGE
jgi:hypothetical protein